MEYRLFLDAAGFQEPSRALVATMENHAGRLGRDEITEIPQVLEILRPDLEASGWTCSGGKRSNAGISLPTPSGGRVLADAWHPRGTALWVETGRSWTNFAFLQHAVEAALVPEVHDVVLAVRQRWKGQSTFGKCAAFLDELSISERFRFPYRSLVLVGF